MAPHCIWSSLPIFSSSKWNWFKYFIQVHLDMDKRLCICSLFAWRRIAPTQIAKMMGPTWCPPGSCRPDINTVYMLTPSNGNIFRVTGPLCGVFTGDLCIPTQRPVNLSFDVCFDVRLNKRLNKQSSRRGIEALLRSLWHHCSELFLLNVLKSQVTDDGQDVTYGGRDKMSMSLQTAFSNQISSKESDAFYPNSIEISPRWSN